MAEASTATERNAKELTVAEEMGLKNLNPQELSERRKELQKMRALQSYYTAKAKRMKKIKSKRYHKVLKKSKAKRDEKERESRAGDPALAQEVCFECKRKQDFSILLLFASMTCAHRIDLRRSGSAPKNG